MSKSKKKYYPIEISYEGYRVVNVLASSLEEAIKKAENINVVENLNQLNFTKIEVSAAADIDWSREQYYPPKDEVERYACFVDGNYLHISTKCGKK